MGTDMTRSDLTTVLETQARIWGDSVSRRSWLRRVSAFAATAGVLSLQDEIALFADDLRRQGRSLIVLWMAGGPSQLETFDPKPGTNNGGPTKSIQTSVPGIEIAAGWEQTARVMSELAVIRSMTNKEGNHPRATYQLHTSYIPSGSVKHPLFGSNIARELAPPAHDLPSVVTIGNRVATAGASFLGVDYEPFHVADAGEMPANVKTSVPEQRLRQRVQLMERLDRQFSVRGGEQLVENQQQLYGKAARLVLSPLTKAFDLSDEPAALKEQYGANEFGQGCLLARRLVEAGVTYVEVRKQGWDTHNDNFDQVKKLADVVDPGCATLISDLKTRGLLEKTVVLWTGEFGRTPKINPRTGRDHFPRAFNSWIAGGGIRGGQVIGSTTADGSAVADRPVSVNDLLASVCKALQVDPNHENMSPLGRPMKIVDGGEAIRELFS